MIDVHASIYAILGLSALAVFRYRDHLSGRGIRHPPSPKWLPFVGNLFSIPPAQEHIAYTMLGKQLNSDMIYLVLPGLKIVVLNSARDASELFDRRSSIYSDRANVPMVTNPALLDWAGFPSMIGNTELWRHHRRMMNHWLNIREVRQFDGLQEDESRLLLMGLLDISTDPQPFNRVKRQFFFTAASIMFDLAYGYRLQNTQDPFFTNAVSASHYLFKACMYHNFLVNIFPVLSYVPSWLPGMKWKREVRKWRLCKEQDLNEPFEWTKAQVASGHFEPSIISALLQDHDLVAGFPEAERDERLKQLAIVLYVAGTDSTSATILNFVAAMVMHPEIQSKAQKEIDDLIGHATRLPVLSDLDRLPYVQNLIIEVLRWRPVGTTGGPPHVCSQDDVYKGYNIEKGTIMIGNVWAMSRDESVYPDPETFNPGRYLDPAVPIVPGFGWGRRQCPGIHFADASLFILISSLLATFTFSKKKDAQGREIIPKLESESNALAMELHEFEFEFTPRSEKHRQLIVDAAQKSH